MGKNIHGNFFEIETYFNGWLASSILMVFYFSPLKFEGLDGFPFGFYQSFWDLLKLDMLILFDDMYDMKIGVRDFGAISFSHIVILAKKEAASSLRDFRPISITHEISKIISKVLMERLNVCLGDCIGINQSGFIDRMSIHDSFLWPMRSSLFPKGTMSKVFFVILTRRRILTASEGNF